MLKIQASCFFLLGSDGERQSLHRDLLRRIQHKSAPSAALPAAARPGGDRWRIVPAFLHRASAVAEAAARRRGPARDLSLPGKGLVRGRRGTGRARPRCRPCPTGRPRERAAARALRFLARQRCAGRRLPRRQLQSAASSSCPRSRAVAAAPGPNAPSAPRPDVDPAAASTLSATSTGAPDADPRGHGCPQHGRFYFSPQRQNRFPARSRKRGVLREGCAGRRGCFPQGAGGPGRRKGAETRTGGAALRPGEVASHPLPRPLFWGAAAFNTPYSAGAHGVIFPADVRAQGRPRRGGGRGLPEPLSPPLARLVARKPSPVRPGEAKRGGRAAGAGAPSSSPGSCPAGPAGAAPGPGLRRRALPASSARNLFTSNYQKINVLRTALLICYN